MKPEQSLREKQQIFMDVLNQMRDYTAPSLSQICGTINENTGELVGSATIIEPWGKPYLLTAEHVARMLFKIVKGKRKYASGLSHTSRRRSPSRLDWKSLVCLTGRSP